MHQSRFVRGYGENQGKNQLPPKSSLSSTQDLHRIHGTSPSRLRMGCRRHTDLPVWVSNVAGHFASVILIKPAVCQGLLDVGPLHGIWLQQRTQEINGSWEDVGQRTHLCHRLEVDATKNQGTWSPSPEPLWGSSTLRISECPQRGDDVHEGHYSTRISTTHFPVLTRLLLYPPLKVSKRSFHLLTWGDKRENASSQG